MRLSKKKKVDILTYAAEVVRRATGHSSTGSENEKDPAAVLLGRRGGLKGGRVRAERLSPKRRKEIARKAALARWRKRA